MSSDALMRLAKDLATTTLVAENYRVLNKKKKSTRDILDLGVKNIVGSSLLRSI